MGRRLGRQGRLGARRRRAHRGARAPPVDGLLRERLPADAGVLRRARGAIRRRARSPTWRDAFEPAPHVAVVDRAPNGAWEPWVARFPPGRGLPGIRRPATGPFSVRGYLRQAATLLGELLRSAQREARRAGRARPRPRRARPTRTRTRSERRWRPAPLRAARHGGGHLRGDGPAPRRDGRDSSRRRTGAAGLVLPLVDAIAAATRRALEALVGGDGELRRIWQVIDLILAILRGSVAHRPGHRPARLRRHQRLRLAGVAAPARGVRAVARLGLHARHLRSRLRLRGRRRSRPRLAAGVALRGAMRMFFTYRGALFWRMKAGMGDVVFAPLYQVLEAARACASSSSTGSRT